MNRFNLILVSVLAIQLVLTASVYLSTQSSTHLPQQKALLEASMDTIDRITIDDAQDNRSVLTKVDGQWQLAEYHQLPANQNSVNNMLSLLQKTNTGWPVATTSSSRKRFKLADEEFNKKIVISSGSDYEQILYLGTSPGFRQLHVRRSAEDEVYAVKLNSHDFPVKNSDLIDNTLLQLSAEIDMIKGENFKFNKQEGSWTTVNLEAKANEKAIKKLSSTLSGLIVLGAEKIPEEITDQHELSIASGEKNYNYRIFKQGDQRLVHRNDHELAFIITKPDYDSITTQNAQTLVIQEQVDDDNLLGEENKSKPSGEMTESSSQQKPEDDQNKS